MLRLAGRVAVARSAQGEALPCADSAPAQGCMGERRPVLQSRLRLPFCAGALRSNLSRQAAPLSLKATPVPFGGAERDTSGFRCQRPPFTDANAHPARPQYRSPLVS